MTTQKSIFKQIVASTAEHHTLYAETLTDLNEEVNGTMRKIHEGLSGLAEMNSKIAELEEFLTKVKEIRKGLETTRSLLINYK